MDQAEPARNPRDETEIQHRRAVERVIAAMKEHLDEVFSLGEMAEVAYMSPFHFNRVFSQVTGVPPRRFLTAMRLETAKRLLVTTDASITDISLDVGYSSLGTFSRRFAELVGVAPSRFRSLPEEGLEQCLEPLKQRPPRSSEAVGEGGVTGRVEAPEGFCGPVFVGLFPSAIPQSRPVACALLDRPGSFRLGPVADGEYNLVSAGLPWSDDPNSYLLYESVLRGGLRGRPVRVRRSRADLRVRLALRRPRPVDPPILLTFPVLLQDLRSRSPVRSTAGAGLH